MYEVLTMPENFLLLGVLVGVVIAAPFIVEIINSFKDNGK